MTTDIEPAVSRPSLLAKFGARYSLEPAKVYETLCKTAFASAQSQEQVVALLVVADQYGLNPFTKEIFAFPDKGGGVVPVVGVDGWNRIAQQHPQFDGVEFRYAENVVTPQGGKACPEWIEAIVHRSDREHPVVVREYLDECYRSTGPWQSHTKRMLRHKALIQGYRTAFGFHGIYDPDEAERISETNADAALSGMPVSERVAARIGADVDDNGEVIEAQVAEDAAPDTETALSGVSTVSESADSRRPSTGRKRAAAQTPDETDDNVLPLRPEPATKKQLAEIDKAYKASGIYEAEFASVIDTYGDFTADGYGLTSETAGYVLEALAERGTR